MLKENLKKSLVVVPVVMTAALPAFAATGDGITEIQGIITAGGLLAAAVLTIAIGVKGYGFASKLLNGYMKK